MPTGPGRVTAALGLCSGSLRQPQLPLPTFLNAHPRLRSSKWRLSPGLMLPDSASLFSLALRTPSLPLACPFHPCVRPALLVWGGGIRQPGSVAGSPWALPGTVWDAPYPSVCFRAQAPSLGCLVGVLLCPHPQPVSCL